MITSKILLCQHCFTAFRKQISRDCVLTPVSKMTSNNAVMLQYFVGHIFYANGKHFVVPALCDCIQETNIKGLCTNACLQNDI